MPDQIVNNPTTGSFEIFLTETPSHYNAECKDLVNAHIAAQGQTPLGALNALSKLLKKEYLKEGRGRTQISGDPGGENMTLHISS